MDALVHGVESLASRHANPLSTAYATQAVAMVSRWLPRAVADGTDLEARAQMLLAAHLAGLALSISGLGLVHGIAHSVTAHTGAVHGLALCAVLGEVMTFSLDSAAPAFAAVAAAMDTGPVPADAPGLRAVALCRDLAAQVGTDVRLRDLGCTRELLPAVAAGAVADAVTVNAPRIPTVGQVQDILTAAL